MFSILPRSWRRSIRYFVAAGCIMYGTTETARAADFIVANDFQLRTAIQTAAAGDTITFLSNVTLINDLPPVTTSVIINGNGFTVNAAGNQAFAVTSGTVQINSVTIDGAVARGANGRGGSDSLTPFVNTGGGGGGAGLGGAIFVGTGATVSVSNVSLTNNAAVGGNGGNPGSSSSIPGTGGAGSQLVPNLPNFPTGGAGGTTVGGSGTAGTTIGNGGGAGANGDPGDPNNATPVAATPGGNGAAGGYGAGGGGGGSGGGSSPTPPPVPGTPGTGASGGGWGTLTIYGGGAGGDGSVNNAGGGGGGAGMGGAVFVQDGGTLSFGGSFTVNGNSVSGGSGAAGGSNGDAFGSGMFLMNGVNVIFAPGTGQTQVISDAITDELGSSGDIAATSGGITKNGLGTTVLLGTNSYTGGTTVNGGILQGNSTSLQGFIRINADGTVVFDQNFSGTFGGPGDFSQIVGDGVVIKEGTGILTYGQTQDNRGGTFINQGTLRAGVIDALPGGQDVFIASGATLDLNSFNNSIGGLNGSGTVTLGSAQLTIVPEVDPGFFSGNITGTGSILKNGAARQVLTGINTYTGGTVIDGGTLQGNTLSLQGLIQVNAQLIFDQNFNGTFNGTLSGAGGVTKTGTAELIFNTPQSAGTTTISDGVLTVNSTLSSSVLVNPFGRLGGTGTVGSTVVNGTISPGNSAIGTLTVNGNYTQNAGSNYQTQINSAGQNDLIAVNGSAQINGGTVQVLPASGGIRRNQAFTILSATGGVSGQYDGIFGSGIGYIETNLIYNPNNIQVLLTSDFKSLGGTFNQTAVENYLDTLVTAPGSDLDNVILSIDTLSPSQARAAMDQIGGAQNASLLMVGGMRNLYLMQQIADSARMTTLDNPIPGSSNVVRGASPDSEGGFLGDGGLRPWFKGYGLSGNVSGDGNAPGADYTFGGGLIGFEVQPESSTRMGLIAGYTNNNITFTDNMAGDAKGNGAVFGGYLMQNFGALHVLAAGNYGYTQYDTSRQITFANINRTAEGSPDVNDGNLYLETGYLIPIAGFAFQPIAGLQYMYLNQGAFTETGANSLNLSEGSASTQSLWASVGGRLTMPYQKGDWSWRPYIHGKWVRDCLSEDALITGSLTGAGGAFAVRGVAAGKDFGVGGCGITFQHGNIRVTADYTTLSGDQQFSNTGSAAVEVRW